MAVCRCVHQLLKENDLKSKRNTTKWEKSGPFPITLSIHIIKISKSEMVEANAVILDIHQLFMVSPRYAVPCDGRDVPAREGQDSTSRTWAVCEMRGYLRPVVCLGSLRTWVPLKVGGAPPTPDDARGTREACLCFSEAADLDTECFFASG